MNYPIKENLNCNTCTEKSIKLHYPEFWEHLIKNYPSELLWGERLYWFYNDLTDYPICPMCGKKVGFINFRVGYKTYCSRRCLNNDPIKKEKTKQTCLKRYGGVAPASSQEIVLKMQNTMLERYGVDNIQKLDSTKEKTRQTCLDKYNGQGNESEILKFKYINTCVGNFGVVNPMKSPEIQNKFNKNFKKKYNLDYPVLLKKCTDNLKLFKQNITLSNHEEVLDTNGNIWICKCPHPKCNKCSEKCYIITSNIFLGRKRDNTELCTRLLPIGKDNTKNTTLEIFIKNILSDIECESNNRTILKPKELDIYIPSKNIAIECNGVFSHSTRYKTNLYHLNKYLECQKQNIRLLTIWEDWIKNKPEIVESLIKNKLGLNNNTIYARKTIIQEIDSKTCNTFLDNNHIQGRSAATVRLGLYYNDELVSIMTFSPPRVNMGSKNHKQQWELVRFCNKLNTRVVGGASKLLKYFIKNYQPTSIVSFSMNDISDGGLYEKLGFKTDNKVTQSYWYIEPCTLKRYHRTSFTKQAIVKKGWKDKIDNTWTEKQAMEEQGYYCIYDTGQLKWVLEL